MSESVFTGHMCIFQGPKDPACLDETYIVLFGQ